MAAPYSALVIGGGIAGLSALYQLARLGCQRAGLLEQFPLLHGRGSSHGHSRVTRTAYANATYVRLMQVVRTQEWPRLERDAGCKLIHPTHGCFFGPPGGRQEKYAQAALASGVDVERIGAVEARRRFPGFRFEDNADVLHDRTAGLVAAADTLEALIRLARRQGADLKEGAPVLGIDPLADPIRVETEGGPLETERLIVAAGPWAARLLPPLGPRLKVARQTVGYFKLAGDPEAYRPGRFPVWGNLGDGSEDVYYGLPEFGREGIKIARHITAGRNDDPDETPGIEPQEIDLLRAFLEKQFLDPVARFLGAETCLYTNTETEDFILDLHPQNRNIAIGAGFSGHGFKFGPLTGRILAELALHGKTTVPEFEEARETFAIGR